MKKINTATRQLLIFGCAILLLADLTACSGNVYNGKSENSSQNMATESTVSEDGTQDEVYEFQVEVDEDSSEMVEFGYSFSDDAE